MTEVELKDLFERSLASLGLPREPLLLDDVEAANPQIADVFAHESRDIVIPNQEQVDWHILAITD
jgi:hypothetical protein